MFSSVPRIAGLLAATSLALASLATAAHAQTGAQGRPDATNVQMVSVPETYCRTIDNTDMTGQDYYFSAADVTAKSGKVIQSHNGGSCCTAAKPWTGTQCAAPPVCAAGTELVSGSCVPTAASCAATGMTLINGACGVAAPTCDVTPFIGKRTTFIMGGNYEVINKTTIVNKTGAYCIEQWCLGGGTYYYPINQSDCSFTNGSQVFIKSNGLNFPAYNYIWPWEN